MDPSDPRRGRRQQVAGGLNFVVVLAASLVNVAMAPLWAATASASTSSLAPYQLPRPFLHPWPSSSLPA